MDKKEEYVEICGGETFVSLDHVDVTTQEAEKKVK